MALIQRKTEDQKAETAAAKAQQKRDAEIQQHLASIEKARQAFYATPAGQARIAFDRGDKVFQYSHNVMSQQAVIVAMVGSSTTERTTNPTVILNSVCHEGWEIVNGSFVFIEQGQQSRDKLMSSGQNVAIKGMTMGYYLFKRCDVNRVENPRPWELPVRP